MRVYKLTDNFLRVIEGLDAMKHPSVARILEHHGYHYEANVIQELMSAWEDTEEILLPDKPYYGGYND